MRKIENVNLVSLTPLISPGELKKNYPLTEEAAEFVGASRETIQAILDKRDSRLLVIVGPCSIHDTEAALDYARRLKRVADYVNDKLFIVMRTYFEKPRTTVGWKGLINDPHLDGSRDVPAGLAKTREFLSRLADIGLPAGTELLDPIVPHYISDFISWASIGARTSESQTHRAMASGFSMPIGFKNGTDGNLQVAIDALIAASGVHHFLGIDDEGRTCVAETLGNPASHIILRGGGGRPNYDPVSIFDTKERLAKAGLPFRIVVDCSHANSGKRPTLQAHVLRDVVQQRIDGDSDLVGVMLESFLEPGNQSLGEDPGALKYGLSITDACLGWEETERILRRTYARLDICAHCDKQ